MIQRVRRVGNSCVVTIPKDEMDRLGIAEGDFIRFEPEPMEFVAKLRPELRGHARDSWERNQEAYLYLKDR